MRSRGAGTAWGGMICRRVMPDRQLMASTGRGGAMPSAGAEMMMARGSSLPATSRESRKRVSSGFLCASFWLTCVRTDGASSPSGSTVVGVGAVEAGAGSAAGVPATLSKHARRSSAEVMAVQSRTGGAAALLVSAVGAVQATSAKPKRSDFFGLLERLHALHGDDLESLDAMEPEHLRIWLSSYAGLGFPASDITLAERMPGDARVDYRVQASFFGLHGPDSPLPSYYLDRLAYEAGQGIGLRPAFLDFFHHRLLTLLHQAWRKYRYFVRFQQEARDHFSGYVFALVGLNDKDLRGSTPIPWSRLLSYAGLIASRSRSPSFVAGVVAHCFDLSSVRIREFEQRYMDVPDDQRAVLGRRNGVLGESLVVGDRVRTRHSKFTIVISDLDQVRFREFLPNGESFDRLRKLMDFLLRDPSAYDLELGLKREEVPSMNLSHKAGAHLGWTSFIDMEGARVPARIRIKVRL